MSSCSYSKRYLLSLGLNFRPTPRVLSVKGDISKTWQVLKKNLMAQQLILTFQWLKKHPWNAICACTISFSRINCNVRIFSDTWQIKQS